MAVSLFRTRRALESLTVAAIGTSLAAVTGLAFSLWFGANDRGTTLISMLSTLAFGSLWAWLLRSPKTLGTTGIRVAWLYSVPLAALNAAFAAGMLLATSERGSFIGKFLIGFVAGLSFGAIIWVPALVATLLLFGAPIAWGQRLARQGLAGQERGDGFVGGVCAVLGLGATAGALAWPARVHGLSEAIAAVGVLGALLGGAVVLAAVNRALQRRRFVSDVEAGRVEGFRVDAAPEGRVLVRIVRQGDAYRVADFVEEVAALGRDGDILARR